jgi:predicted nucleotidyltransferase component of viral defense system
MLKHLFVKSKFKHDIYFKGGTSLSKCYGLIQRFSEDIDIIS